MPQLGEDLTCCYRLKPLHRKDLQHVQQSKMMEIKIKLIPKSKANRFYRNSEKTMPHENEAGVETHKL